jgi:hypothetical protein
MVVADMLNPRFANAPLNPVIAPGWAFTGNPQNQINNLFQPSRPASTRSTFERLAMLNRTNSCVKSAR